MYVQIPLGNQLSLLHKAKQKRKGKKLKTSKHKKADICSISIS